MFVGPGFDAAQGQSLAEYGAAKVYVADGAELVDYLVAPTAEVLAKLVADSSPAAVLLAVRRGGQGDRRPAGGQDRLRRASPTRPT